jgi:hypothetical protein
VGFFIQGNQVAAGQHALGEQAIFAVRTVTPVDFGGLGQTGDVLDPSVQGFQRTCHDFPFRAPGRAFANTRETTLAAENDLGKVNRVIERANQSGTSVAMT